MREHRVWLQQRLIGQQAAHPRFEQVMELLQAIATGHAERFDSIERRLDRLEREPVT